MAADKNFGLTALNVRVFDSLVKKHLNTNNNLLIQNLDHRLNIIKRKHQDLFMELIEMYNKKHIAFNFIQETNFIVPKFHILPKLHKLKPKEIHEKNAESLPTRPIAGAHS